MNFNKYLKIVIKQFVPFYIVSFAIMFCALFEPLMIEVYTRSYCDGTNCFASLTPTSGILSVSIVFMLLCLVMPFLAMGSRYSMTASDTYCQVAQKRNEIRLINNLTLIVSLVASFTLIYFLIVMIVLYRNLTVVLPESSDNVIYTFKMFHFEYYLVAYLALLIFGLLQYFISYLFISRSNNPMNSLIMLVLGELVLMIGLIAPISFLDKTLNALADVSAFNSINVFGLRNASFLLPIFAIYGIFGNLIVTGSLPSMSLAMAIVLLVMLIIYVCLGILGLMAFLFEKDPSSEYAGKPDSDKPYQSVIFHTGFGVIGFAISSSISSSMSILGTGFSISSYISSITVYGALYYVFLGVLRRNFKPDKTNLIIMLTSFGVNLVLGIFILIISVAQMAHTINI